LGNANPDERILNLSYGWGSGSDGLSFVTTKDIETRRRHAFGRSASGGQKDLVMSQIEDKIMLDYGLATKYEHEVTADSEHKYIRSPMMLTNYL